MILFLLWTFAAIVIALFVVGAIDIIHAPVALIIWLILLSLMVIVWLLASVLMIIDHTTVDMIIHLKNIL